MELKECPFCGLNNVHMNDEYDSAMMSDERRPIVRVFFVKCHTCKSIGLWSDTREGAADLWNTRTLSPAVARVVEAAMSILFEQMSMGGIGVDGPTIKELDTRIEDTGRPWEDNSDYHAVQLAWRTLESVAELDKQDG